MAARLQACEYSCRLPAWLQAPFLPRLPAVQSGRRGAVTIATNMAGRGTDILLGGNPGECVPWFM